MSTMVRAVSGDTERVSEVLSWCQRQIVRDLKIEHNVILVLLSDTIGADFIAQRNLVL